MVKVVDQWGDVAKKIGVRSIRKSFLSALQAQVAKVGTERVALSLALHRAIVRGSERWRILAMVVLAPNKFRL